MVAIGDDVLTPKNNVLSPAKVTAVSNSVMQGTSFVYLALAKFRSNIVLANLKLIQVYKV